MGRSACFGCGEGSLHPIVGLGDQPPANALTSTPNPPDEPRYPLDLVLCESCGLAQLTLSVPPEELFSDYAYFSSYSPALVSSAEELAARLVTERGLTGDDLAMEIGSNDGYLLQHYRDRGVPVLGVDPAENIAAAARDRGIPTECAFFGTEVAADLVERGLRPTVIHANNVIAHVPDINGVLRGIADVLASDGVAVIETPYVRHLVERLEFDTIYHEHLFYYSATSFQTLLERNGLRLEDIEEIPAHGGSLRIFAVPQDGRSPGSRAQRYLDEEAELGMTRASYFEDFAERVGGLRSQLRDLIDGLRKGGVSIAGYGAAAKATVMLNAIGASSDDLAFVADQSPHKQGRYVPGTGIPIVDPAALLDQQPDYVLLFAWNLAESILQAQDEYRRRGGRFIIPVPEPRIVEPSPRPGGAR